MRWVHFGGAGPSSDELVSTLRAKVLENLARAGRSLPAYWDTSQLLSCPVPQFGGGLEFEAEQLRRSTDPETAQTVKDLMVKVVDEGIANGASVPGVEVGGKTAG